MRVAIYSGAIPSTTFIENLIRGLASSDVAVLLFGTINKKIVYASKHVHIHSTPKNRMLLLLFILLNVFQLLIINRARFIKLYSYLKAKGNLTNLRLWGKYLPIVRHLPDIFHLQWAKGAEDWLFLKELYGVKLVVSFRGAHINYSPIYDKSLADSYRRGFPHYDAFHCVSKAIALEGLKYGASLEKSYVIYPAVDVSLLATKKAYASNEKLQILSIGRDHWKKGYPVALDAMALLKERGLDFHYTIVAGGEKEELKYQIADLKLGDNVTLIDALPHAKVLDLYGKSDLFLLPSYEEGVANVVLEAMALGRPVISTNCGGMAEVIEDGVNGFLVPVRDPQAIAETVVKYSTLSEAAVNLMLDHARKTIMKQHLLTGQIEAMVELYKSVQND